MRRTFTLWAGGVALFAGVAAAWVIAGGAEEPTITQFDAESQYFRIRVIDYPQRDRRYMRFSKPGPIQSTMVISDPQKLELRHAQSMMAALALHPAPKDVLLVGLGGAAIPRFIQRHFPDMRLDIVELDPEVVKVCQEWFAFKGTPNTRVIVMDGRMYLKRSAKTYDVILLDAYSADHIPFHLTTREFLELVKSRLAPGGAAAANLWEPGLAAATGMGPAVSRLYLASLKTYQLTFPQTYLCKSGTAGKIIAFGSPCEKVVTVEEWAKRAEALASGRNFGFDLPAIVRTEYEHLTPQAIAEKPLTDDLAPVDTLRREHPKYFDEDSAK